MAVLGGGGSLKDETLEGGWRRSKPGLSVASAF